MRFIHHRAINLIGEEWRNRSGHLRDCGQAFEQRLICSRLVGPRFTFPKAPPIAPYVPIRKLFDGEIADEACRARRIVSVHRFGVLGGGRIQKGENPLVYIGPLRDRYIRLSMLESVDVRVEREERVGVQ